MRPKIAFVGAGAVGGYLGGHLARLGHDVTLIDAWPAHVEAIRARGLALTGIEESQNVTVQVRNVGAGSPRRCRPVLCTTRNPVRAPPPTRMLRRRPATGTCWWTWTGR